MRAYLIYHREEAAKNQRFLWLFMKAGKESGIEFFYVPYENYREEELPDLVLNRTRDAEVSRWYEKRQVAVFHSSHVTEIGNHKGKTLDFLKGHLPKEVLQTKWAPKTVPISKERLAKWQSALAAGDFWALHELKSFKEEEKPFVIKSVGGHGGSGVMSFLPPEETEWKDVPDKYCENLNQRLKVLSGKDCILQEMIPSHSRDIRVYIVGNRIYQAMMRQGQDDFRSNASLGGRTEVYSLSRAEKNYVGYFLQAFEGEILGLAGLDFIMTEDGRLVFNELEEMVGCRMVYQNTQRDIVRDYVRWLEDYTR